MSATKILSITASGIVLFILLLWFVDYTWQTRLIPIAMRTAAGFVINGLLTGLSFIASMLFLIILRIIEMIVKRDSSYSSGGFITLGPEIFLIMFGAAGIFIGAPAGAVIGGFAVPAIIGAIIGAAIYLIYFFAFNGIEGRILCAETFFGQIMLAVVPAIFASFAGALTSRILN